MSEFLDDILYDHIQGKELKNADDFKSMMNELYEITEQRWKPQFKIGMTKKDAKILLDRVFNSWDLLIKRLEKEDYFLLKFIKPETYKEQFMRNEQLKNIYKTL